MEAPRLTAALVALTMLSLNSCGSAQRHLTVIQTTDLHGAFSAPDGGGPGGLRQLAALVDQLRESDPQLVLIDGGDMWSGTLLSDRDEGATGVAAYNLLGYDAVALGNHELDYGPIGPQRLGDPPFEALRARLSEARFVTLAANVERRADGRAPVWPNFAASTMVERDGLNVGIVGLATPDTPRITLPFVRQGLRFTEPLDALVREARTLRAQGADVVIALVHIGGHCDQHLEPDDLSSCRGDSALFRLVNQAPEGLVDAFFGGHTHRVVAHRVAGVPVLQPPALGRGVARLDLTLAGRRVVGSRIALIEVAGRSEASESARAVDALLAPGQRQVAALRAERLGATIAAPLDRDWSAGSRLGAFVCDVLLAQASEREVCLINAGGLRRDLPAGPVTFGAVYDALPFGNAAAWLDLDGRTLAELVRVGTSGAHGSLQTAGLRVTFDRARDACPTVDRDGDGRLTDRDRDRVVSVVGPDGEPLDPDRRYRVVTNSFLASGGDGWDAALSKVPPEQIVIRHGKPGVRDAITAHLRDRELVVDGPTAPLDWRQRVVGTGEQPEGACAP